MTEHSIFDLSQLESRLDGDAELVREILGLFCDDVPIQLASLESAVAGANWQAAARFAHSIKGSAGNVGGLRVHAVAGALESTIRSGEVAGAGDLLQALHSEIDALLKAIADSTRH